MMKKLVSLFVADEAGAVTVDWVVLTAAIIGLGMIVIAPIVYSSNNSAEDVADYIRDVPVGYGN